MVIVGVLVGASAFAPSRMLRPWTGDLGEVAWIPFMPLGMLFGQARAWLRPTIPELDLQSPVAQQLIKERDAYRGLYHGARIENERLQKLLNELARARQAASDAGLTLVPATVVGVDGEGRNPLVRVAQGTAAGIEAGDVVVYGGDALVGRIVDPVGRSGCSVLPVWSPMLKRLDARARDPVGGVDLPLQVHLGSDGSLRAQAPSGIELPTGTEVLLDDRDWPRAAQGLLIGTIESIEHPDDSPLQRLHRLRFAAPRQGLDVVVIRYPSARAPR